VCSVFRVGDQVPNFKIEELYDTSEYELVDVEGMMSISQLTLLLTGNPCSVLRVLQ
jgi:hypothetical protein